MVYRQFTVFASTPFNFLYIYWNQTVKTTSTELPIPMITSQHFQSFSVYEVYVTPCSSILIPVAISRGTDHCNDISVIQQGIHWSLTQIIIQNLTQTCILSNNLQNHYTSIIYDSRLFVEDLIRSLPVKVIEKLANLSDSYPLVIPNQLRKKSTIISHTKRVHVFSNIPKNTTATSRCAEQNLRSRSQSS